MDTISVPRTQRVGIGPSARARAEAARLGADVATIPYPVIEQLVGHPLTDGGIERFLADWRAKQGE